MKRFLTVFPYAANVHLVKDVGMIPYILHKELGYQSTLLCYRNGDYPFLANKVAGLKIHYLKMIFRLPLLDLILFFLFNANQYQVAQFYHLRRINLILCFLFKALTFGKGKTYLKMDADGKIMDYKSSKFIRYLFQYVDLVSVESKAYVDYLNNSMLLGKKVAYIPNGYDDQGIREEVAFEHKKNKIITVGRIGTKQKATEILCKAFETFAVHHPDWTLAIIGPIEDQFHDFIANYFLTNPSLKERVTFTGQINKRDVLERHYREAKVFVLCSRYEGFPLVLTEAARFGCHVISTALPAASDIVDVNKYGALFDIDDEGALATLLINNCEQQAQLALSATGIQSFAYANFYWPKICRTIDLLLWK